MVCIPSNMWYKEDQILLPLPMQITLPSSHLIHINGVHTDIGWGQSYTGLIQDAPSTAERVECIQWLY